MRAVRSDGAVFYGGDWFALGTRGEGEHLTDGDRVADELETRRGHHVEDGLRLGIEGHRVLLERVNGKRAPSNERTRFEDVSS